MTLSMTLINTVVQCIKQTCTMKYGIMKVNLWILRNFITGEGFWACNDSELISSQTCIWIQNPRHWKHWPALHSGLHWWLGPEYRICKFCTVHIWVTHKRAKLTLTETSWFRFKIMAYSELQYFHWPYKELCTTEIKWFLHETKSFNTFWPVFHTMTYGNAFVLCFYRMFDLKCWFICARLRVHD